MEGAAGDSRVTLRDGSKVLIRQVHRDDVPLLVEGFERLSAESRKLRFLTDKPRLSRAELRYFTKVDHHDHEALGALDEADGSGLGIARYIRSAGNPEVAEIAVAIADDWQRRGLGTELLSRLIERAREEGIRRFTALVAADNEAMTGLLRRLGAAVGAAHREGDTIEFEIRVADLPARSPGPKVPVGGAAPGAWWPGEEFSEEIAMRGFRDRVEAGRLLAERLEHLRGQDIVVLGLPRGGVPVAFEVATALGAPLDVIAVRKLGVPFQPELAMGAIGEGGFRVVDRGVLDRARVSPDELAAVERREQRVLDERVASFRRGRERLDLHGRVAVVVDDGVATGSTARVACQVARHLGAAKVVLAVPVAPIEMVQDRAGADEFVCVTTPEPFYAVGQAYRDFSPTSDEEVVVLLDAAGRQRRSTRADGQGADSDLDVEIPVGGLTLEGHLHLPETPVGVVVFAHGSGSSRHSPRNRFVASVLQHAGLGTLLLDLLTAAEERDRGNVFDIDLLASRLVAATRWLASRPDTASARIGLFGASTGAAAALVAAAQPGMQVAAVVSRGGRPDLAGPHLGEVTTPTLLVVGSADRVVLELNQQARAQLGGPSRLAVVQGATHLFEEPGTLAEAAALATDWFVRYLLPGEAVAPGDR